MRRAVRGVVVGEVRRRSLLSMNAIGRFFRWSMAGVAWAQLRRSVYAVAVEASNLLCM